MTQALSELEQIGNLLLLNFVNQQALSHVSSCNGALPLLMPMSSKDPYYDFFKKVYEKINENPNGDPTTRLQISIIRSIYQNKVKYFTCTKKTLIDLSASDTMLKHKVQKIHKNTYSRLGREFPCLYVNCVRKMNGFIPSIWCLDNQSDMASWTMLTSQELASQLSNALNYSFQNIVASDDVIAQMSSDELFVINNTQNNSQSSVNLIDKIDISDI